jgi:hypothetical protein
MVSNDKPKEKEGMCFCPYCDEELLASPAPYCQPCQVELRHCLKCNIVVERTAKVCPQCGQTLE